VPPEVYERLAAALAETGSDFASGNVLRLSDGRTSQSPFLAEAFARTRLKTHVRRFRREQEREQQSAHRPTLTRGHAVSGAALTGRSHLRHAADPPPAP
jgi:hypothetical protein